MRKLILATTFVAGSAFAGTAFAQAQAPAPGAAAPVPGAAPGEEIQAQEQPQLKFQGEHVRMIEQALADQGQDIQPDEQWGPESQQALQSYQQEQGLDATGELNFETLAALQVELQQLAEAETGMEAPQAAETPGAGAVGEPADQMEQETAPGQQ